MTQSDQVTLRRLFGNPFGTKEKCPTGIGLRIPRTSTRKARRPTPISKRTRKETIEITSDANRLARDLAKLRKESREYTGSEKLRLISENNRLSKAMAKEFMQEYQQ